MEAEFLQIYKRIHDLNCERKCTFLGSVSLKHGKAMQISASVTGVSTGRVRAGCYKNSLTLFGLIKLSQKCSCSSPPGKGFRI